MKENEYKEIQEIQARIIDFAQKWANEISQGNSTYSNKLNARINKIIFDINEDKELARRILTPLIQNAEPSVRLFASVHSLNQGIEIQKSLQVLEDLADDNTTQGISLMAYINLVKWKKENKAL